MIGCVHWSPHGENAGRCALGKAGGLPSYGVCRLCLAGAEIAPAADHGSPIAAEGHARPGTALKQLLAWLGIEEGGCACNRNAAEMDHRGAGWCLRHVGQISSWLVEEARRRQLPARPLWRIGAIALVLLAVVWSLARGFLTTLFFEITDT